MKLITFEGIEKVGKTTNIKYIADFLLKKNYEIKLTREPGGTSIGEKIRSLILKKKKDININSLTELFLILAARYEHIEKVIIPAIIQQKIVLCDRYIDSTYAYQSGGRSISIKKISAINKIFFNKIFPDFVFLLNYPINKSLFKIKKKAKFQIV